MVFTIQELRTQMQETGGSNTPKSFIKNRTTKKKTKTENQRSKIIKHKSKGHSKKRQADRRAERLAEKRGQAGRHTQTDRFSKGRTHDTGVNQRLYGSGVRQVHIISLYETENHGFPLSQVQHAQNLHKTCFLK